jgi:hypothetical protein
MDMTQQMVWPVFAMYIPASLYLYAVNLGVDDDSIPSVEQPAALQLVAVNHSSIGNINLAYSGHARIKRLGQILKLGFAGVANTKEPQPENTLCAIAHSDATALV